MYNWSLGVISLGKILMEFCRKLAKPKLKKTLSKTILSGGKIQATIKGQAEVEL